MRISFTSLILLFLLIKAEIVKAQLYEINLTEKISQSTHIIEGKVVDKTSFWNPGHTMIFTTNKVEVYKIFKGNNIKAFIEILTQGGSVGNDYIEASDVLSLEKGNLGIFFCYPNTIKLQSPLTNEVLFDVYSSKQGFLKYDLNTNKAYAPFVEYDDIEGNLYKLLKEKTGNAARTLNASFKIIPVKKKDPSARPDATATITSFSPAIVNAGALNNPASNVLTINGTGFGTAGAGKQLLFKDADNTNATADYAIESTSQYIISWTDRQILVRVPQRAATGTFGVSTAVGDVGYAPTNLEVLYSVLNASFSGGSIISEPRLMNANGTGGYTIVYSTNTAGGGTNITTDSAYVTFRRAVRTWKEIVGANITEGGNTTNQVVNAGDNINTIMFDNTNTGNPPVPSGTLAITYSSFGICGGATFSQKNGFDMVIRRESVSATPVTPPYNKSYCSPSINTYDFETTVLHELGHALNLGHTNEPQEQTSDYTNRNPAKLMHPSVSLSVARKALDQSAYAGALYNVTPQKNTNYGTCIFNAEMVATTAIVTPYNECPASFPAAAIAPGTSVFIDLDHATSNKYRDPQFRAIGTEGSTSGQGVTVTNNAYYAIKTNANGTFQFAIVNYTTFPSEALANCTNQGVRMAIYQVNDCPTGQAFPAPVYTTTFNSTTTRSLTGLTANTNYLLYFDGINGTKPAFNIVFNNNLTGKVLIFPNPVRDNLTIDLSFLQQGQYFITIVDALGRRVYTQQSGAALATVPFKSFAKGVYFVKVIDEQNNTVLVNKILK